MMGTTNIGLKKEEDIKYTTLSSTNFDRDIICVKKNGVVFIYINGHLTYTPTSGENTAVMAVLPEEFRPNVFVPTTTNYYNQVYIKANGEIRYGIIHATTNNNCNHTLIYPVAE